MGVPQGLEGPSQPSVARGRSSLRLPKVVSGRPFELRSSSRCRETRRRRGSDKGEPLSGSESNGRRGGRGGNHFANFITAVRSRKMEDLTAPILEGHYSAALIHLANASYRLGDQVPFNPTTKAFGDNKEAYETLARMEEYLKENKVNLQEAKYQLGRKLIVDAHAEMVVGDNQANSLLTRNYRKPFVVPDTV